MEIDSLSLQKAGLTEQEQQSVAAQTDAVGQIRVLRKCRYRILEEIHTMQQSLDALDYLVHKLKTTQ